MWWIVETLFWAAAALWIFVFCLREGWKLIKTHDFTGSSLADRIDPAKKASAAKYFGALLIAMSLIVASALLLPLLPPRTWVLLMVPPALWFFAFFGGAIYFARPLPRKR